MAFIDLTGNKYGRLTVIKRVENQGNKSMWQCLCDCGNVKNVRADSLKNGNIKSCGCLLREETGRRNFKDLTGQKIGRWTVLGRAENRNKNVNWKCRCDCGTERDVLAVSLLNGLTQSCGCYKNEISHELNFIDMTGERHGMLTVIKRVDDYISHHGARTPKWLCKCDCGNTKEMFGQGLRNGTVISCGCVSTSNGEYLVESILKEKDIKYYKQYKFTDCKNIIALRFDFYLPDYNACIEYDGRQHFEPIEYFGGEKDFKAQKYRDEIKDTYCRNNNIKLLRLPYFLNNDQIEKQILNILNP